MDNKTIAVNIRKIRLALDLTQEQMADSMGVGRTTFINFESGKTSAVSKNVFKMAEASGMEPEDVLLGPRFQERAPEQLQEMPDAGEVRRTLVEQHRREMDEKDICINNLTEALEAHRRALESDAEAIGSLKNQIAMLKAQIIELEGRKS